jgi:N-acetylglutamate synthase-like GNAT family acetyltransferase
MAFLGDGDYVRTRWTVDPTAAFVAETRGEVAGSNFATKWGSVGFFGPLTVHPSFWDSGIGQHLMEPVMECFTRWNVTHAGLYTFPHSTKHVGLYQKFGFSPRFLTAIMSKAVEHRTATPSSSRLTTLSPADQNAAIDRTATPSSSRLTTLSPADQNAAIDSCRDVTDAIYDGLDVTREIRAVLEQKLGEVIFLRDGSRLTGFAVCHFGPGTEAGSGKCYIKFAAVKPGPNAEATFASLLNSCEAMATAKGLTRMIAGVNTSRSEAYRQLLTQGFRTDIQGVAMHKPNESAYHHPGVYVIDDWR